MSDHLASWHDTDTRKAIVDFVERVTTAGSEVYVPPAERVAVFDNDGTLWCEKPMPIELGFILHRLAEMAEVDESLRGKQPWKAARDGDHHWLGEVITKHYHGDDDDLKVLMGGILQAFAGKSVEEYSSAAAAFRAAAVSRATSTGDGTRSGVGAPSMNRKSAFRPPA